MPRCRTSICAYWLISVMIVIVLTLRLLIEQRTVIDITRRRQLSNQRNFAFDWAQQNTRHNNETRCSQVERLDQLSRHCAESSRTSRASGRANATERQLKSGFDFLLVDDKHKVIYCAIPKAASTTWKAVMARATGHSSAGDSMPEHQVEDSSFLRSIGLRYLSSYTDAEAAVRLADYFKFTVVRHPLTRLVSAYRDKVARFNSYGVDLRQRIVAFSSADRPSSSSLSPVDGNVTTRANIFQRITFKQFARYVIDQAASGKFDHHWSPYDQLCHFCHVRYDFVGKLETLDSDSYRIVSRLYASEISDGAGLRDRVPRFNARRRRTPTAVAATTSNDTMTSSMRPISNRPENQLSEFDTLSPTEADRLIDLYAVDLRMFGYGWTKERSLATCQHTLKVRNGTCC